MRNWILVVIVGIAVALVGSLVIVLTKALLKWKFDTVTNLIDENKWGEAFFSYIAFSLFFVAVSACIVYCEPKAAGSGISEVKAYLNGVNVNDFLTPKVTCAKAIGVCFSVASGLPIGRKAPMVHVGAAMAANICQGFKHLFNLDVAWTRFQDFRNDHTKTDYMTYGIAAGISATFRFFDFK
jgi:chloride channel 7